MIEVRKSTARGKADHGWLLSYHTFSFADYYDPQQVGFSDLLVINDDQVMPGMGFGAHPHRNMEILSYVLSGALEHKDSMGNGSVMRPGDVQMMSAGSGVTHSEYNPSATDKVHFLQIWIVPDRQNGVPRYQQQHFPAETKRGKLCLIASSSPEQGGISLLQDVRVHAALLDGAEQIEFALAAERYAYLHVARGHLTVNGIALGPGDGARIRAESRLMFTDGQQAEMLLFDLRPQERSR